MTAFWLDFVQMNFGWVSLSLCSQIEIIFEWKKIFQSIKNTFGFSGMCLHQEFLPRF